MVAEQLQNRPCLVLTIIPQKLLLSYWNKPNPNITSPSFFQKPLMVPEKNLGHTVTISFRNSEEKTNFLSEEKFTHLQPVRLSHSKSTVALAEFPEELVASHPAAIWTRMPFYLTTSLFRHEEWLNHWWQWFHARNSNSWEHQPILATAESSLDLELSKGRFTLVSSDPCSGSTGDDTGESRAAAQEGSPGTIPSDAKLRRSLAACSRGKGPPWRQPGPSEVSSLGSFLGSFLL